MDPVTAIAGAAGSLFDSIGGIWTSISSVKVAKQQTKQVSELTTQEKIKYNQLIASGNTALAMKLLDGKQNEDKSTTWFIWSFVILVALVIIYVKFKNKSGI